MKPVFIVLAICCVSLTSSLQCYSCGQTDGYNVETNEVQSMVESCYGSFHYGHLVDCANNGTCLKSEICKEGYPIISRACVSQKPTGCEKVYILEFFFFLLKPCF